MLLGSLPSTPTAGEAGRRGGDVPPWPQPVLCTCHLPLQRGRWGDGCWADPRDHAVTPSAQGEGVPPHPWSEVGRRQVACRGCGVTLSAGGEREGSPSTTGVSSELTGVSIELKMKMNIKISYIVLAIKSKIEQFS
jgi:hypothetical protein